MEGTEKRVPVGGIHVGLWLEDIFSPKTYDGEAQSVVASFEGNFRAAGVLVSANADVPRILVVPCGRFGRKSR